MWLVLFPIYSQASDTLYRQFVARCENSSSGATTLVLSLKDGASDATGKRVTLTKASDSTNCVGTGVVGTYLTEDGSTATTVSSGTDIDMGSGWKWTTPAKVVTQFGTINQLLASILPLMLAVGFLSTGYLAGRRLSGGMNMMQSIGMEVLMLVVAIVAVFLTPTLIGFLTDAGAVTDGGLSVTSKFGAIIDLVLAVIPLVFTVAVMGITLKSGAGALRAGKGGGEGGLVGGMGM